MSNPGTQRKQIENQLLTLARQVDTHDVRWLDCDDFSQFLGAWTHLAHYYEQNRDTTLDAHVLKQYMHYAAALRRVMQNEQLSPRRRSRAQVALTELNQQLDDVFHQIERNGGLSVAV